MERVSKVTARGSEVRLKVSELPRWWGCGSGVTCGDDIRKVNPTESYLSWQASDIALVDSLQTYLRVFRFLDIWTSISIPKVLFIVFNYVFRKKEIQITCHRIPKRRRQKKPKLRHITIYQVITPEVSYPIVFRSFFSFVLLNARCLCLCLCAWTPTNLLQRSHPHEEKK